MSVRTFRKKPGVTAVYKMYAGLMRMLQSMEGALPRDLYQDLYATLLQLTREQITLLHEELEDGNIHVILGFLNRKSYRDKKQVETNARIIRQARRSGMRRRAKSSLN